MSVKYGKFELPSHVKLVEGATNTRATFIVEPFERGFGHTIGNSLRRIMLTSLEAPAIISIGIEPEITHETMAVEGIVEDMVNIVLNFKGACLRKLPTDDAAYSRDMRFITKVLEITQDDIDRSKGQYVVTLGEVVKDGIFEVVNPELPLFAVTKPMKKHISLRVAFGRGYVPSERLVVRDKTSNEILIDAAFSPVRLVNYTVENTRVGQDTDYDRLVLEVTTDGRVTPQEALSFAAQIALKHFEVFEQIKPYSLSFESGEGDGITDEDEMMQKLVLRIDEIELSVRSANCLEGANIGTIAELVSIPEKKMLEFKNFGKKSLNEIKDKLQEMGLQLGMDLARYGITHDNVKEKIAEYLEEKKRSKEQVEV